MSPERIALQRGVFELLFERARTRYPQLDEQLLERLVRTAVRSIDERNLDDPHAALLAGHVTVARLAGSHIARIERSSLLTANVVVIREQRDHIDHAIAEHLHARLEHEELMVIALRAGRGIGRKVAASALNLELGELDELERSAQVKAGRMVIAYHDEHICEPAALSAADNPAAVEAAVRSHLAGCGSCRREFGLRVWSVLAETGAIVRPLPPLHRPAERRRLVSGGRRAVRALRPRRAQLQPAAGPERAQTQAA